MPAVRRRFRIVLDGEEPIELTTNALDLIRAERDGQGSVAQGMRTAHNAALRLRKPVPVKFSSCQVPSRFWLFSRYSMPRWTNGLSRSPALKRPIRAQAV